MKQRHAPFLESFRRMYTIQTKKVTRKKAQKSGKQITHHRKVKEISQSDGERKSVNSCATGL